MYRTSKKSSSKVIVLNKGLGRDECKSCTELVKNYRFNAFEGVRVTYVQNMSKIIVLMLSSVLFNSCSELVFVKIQKIQYILV